jgi:predicted esterase
VTSHEHHLHVLRSARYYTLGPAPGLAHDIWFVCHGYGQLARAFLDEFAVLDDGTRLLVAPEGLSRYYTRHEAREVGASWMTREDRLAEIADYIAYLDAVYHAVLGAVDRTAARVVALGFSQGAATAARWIALGRAVPDRVVLWGEPLPPDLDLTLAGPKLAETRLTFVFGTEDHRVSPEGIRGAERQLLEHDVPFETIRYAGGHHLDARTLEALCV